MIIEVSQNEQNENGNVNDILARDRIMERL